MINAERFKEEILNIVNDDFYLAVNKNNPNGVSKCGSFPCADCMFSKLEDGKVRCTKNRMNWLLAEYKGSPVKVSKLEYEILKYVQKEGFNFITRSNSDYLYGDLYGNLFIYEIKPIKHDGIAGWCTTGKSYVLYAFSDLFQFVKWEDEKPTSIKEVLNNCEVVEDAEE